MCKFEPKPVIAIIVYDDKITKQPRCPNDYRKMDDEIDRGYKSNEAGRQTGRQACANGFYSIRKMLKTDVHGTRGCTHIT